MKFTNRVGGVALVTDDAESCLQWQIGDCRMERAVITPFGSTGDDYARGRRENQIIAFQAVKDVLKVLDNAGFDPATVRLTGNVQGEPPFRGTLQHGGWRAVDVKLPPPSELDPGVLAPAEVELA